MICLALHERKPGLENQAMLDKKGTAERLKASLHAAFKKWSAYDPRSHTKAELARKLAAMGNGPCTPQDVSGWFSTGRMDKSWIRLVEIVLEERLDFGPADLPEATRLPKGAMVLDARERELVESYRKLSAHARGLDQELAQIDPDLRATAFRAAKDAIEAIREGRAIGVVPSSDPGPTKGGLVGGLSHFKGATTRRPATKKPGRAA